MPGIKEYIEQFGSKSFTDTPFGDADNLTLCQIFYLPFESVVSPSLQDAPKPFSEACNEIFAGRGYRHTRLGLMIPNDASVNSMRMSIQKRFSEMKVLGVETAYEHFPAVQYAAGTFILPTGENVVIFRGTDDSLTGWHEDMDIFLHDDLPSYPLALDYLNRVAEQLEGDIILCGHSKGGHLALYAALKTSDEVRARIKCVYNNDGPGYHDYEIYQSEAYTDLLPRYRHLVPHSSFVGMLLSHDYDYTAVTSSKHLGPIQHDLASWQIVNGSVITRPDVDVLAKITDVAFSDFLCGVSDAEREVMDLVANALIGVVDVETLTEIVKKFPTELKQVLARWGELGEDIHKTFHAAFFPIPKIVANTVKNIKEETVPKAAAAASMLLKKVVAN